MLTTAKQNGGDDYLTVKSLVIVHSDRYCTAGITAISRKGFSHRFDNITFNLVS